MQSDVVSALRALALPVREELVTAQGYSLDAVVTYKDCEVAVEVDGPWHFMGRTPTGATELKRRQLRSAGWTLIAVPYWEWEALGSKATRCSKYLLDALKGRSEDALEERSKPELAKEPNGGEVDALGANQNPRVARREQSEGEGSPTDAAGAAAGASTVDRRSVPTAGRGASHAGSKERVPSERGARASPGAGGVDRSRIAAAAAASAACTPRDALEGRSKDALEGRSKTELAKKLDGGEGDALEAEAPTGGVLRPIGSPSRARIAAAAAASAASTNGRATDDVGRGATELSSDSGSASHEHGKAGHGSLADSNSVNDVALSRDLCVAPGDAAALADAGDLDDTLGAEREREGAGCGDDQGADQQTVPRRGVEGRDEVDLRLSLEAAVSEGDEQAVEALLQQGAKVNLLIDGFNSALAVAAQRGHERVLNVLLRYGAEVDLRSDTGYTALMLAAAYLYPAVVRRLLRAGANTTLHDEEGRTALNFAELAHDNFFSALHDGRVSNHERLYVRCIERCLDAAVIIRALISAEAKARALDALGAHLQGADVSEESHNAARGQPAGSRDGAHMSQIAAISAAATATAAATDGLTGGAAEGRVPVDSSDIGPAPRTGAKGSPLANLRGGHEADGGGTAVLPGAARPVDADAAAAAEDAIALDDGSLETQMMLRYYGYEGPLPVRATTPRAGCDAAAWCPPALRTPVASVAAAAAVPILEGSVSSPTRPTLTAASRGASPLLGNVGGGGAGEGAAKISDAATRVLGAGSPPASKATVTDAASENTAEVRAPGVAATSTPLPAGEAQSLSHAAAEALARREVAPPSAVTGPSGHEQSRLQSRPPPPSLASAAKRRCVRLNGLLGGASCEGLLRLHAQHGEDFDAINLSTCWCRLVRGTSEDIAWLQQENGERLLPLRSQTLDVLANWTSDEQTVANIVHAMGRLQLCGSRWAPLWEAGEGAAAAMAGACTKPQALAMVAWAFAAAGRPAAALFEVLSGAALRIVRAFDPQSLANMAWALAHVNQRVPLLLDAFAAEASSHLSDFGAEYLAVLAWAYAVLDYPAHGLFGDGRFVRRCSAADVHELKDLTQLHQWQLWLGERDFGYRARARLTLPQRPCQW
mmetsp:Transcript_25782/g.76876  ORF Transcript_25782/g.76876 Transcript_25782/m.76876 type:complete len:1113 (-) Transcript_25782:415-3753(-)